MGSTPSSGTNLSIVSAATLANHELSVHDNLLTGYAVDGIARTIVLHTQPPDADGKTFIDVHFDGVAGYQFDDDMLQNIVFDVADADADDFRSTVVELTARYGRAGLELGWDQKRESAEQFFERKELRLFMLTSSYGMSGWVAAKSSTRRLRSTSSAI